MENEFSTFFDILLLNEECGTKLDLYLRGPERFSSARQTATNELSLNNVDLSCVKECNFNKETLQTSAVKAAWLEYDRLVLLDFLKSVVNDASVLRVLRVL